MNRPVLPFALLCLHLTVASHAAEIQVQGITHREVAVDSASFRVVSEAGFTYECRLNGQPIQTDIPITCGVDYYDLSVRRQDRQSGEFSERNLQFIVRSSERGGSEVGLRPWIPFALIQSASAEFAESRLQVVAPSSWPAGLDFPIIAKINSPADVPTRVNGLVQIAGDLSGTIQVRRGWGSSLLPPPTNGTLLTYQATVGPLAQAGSVKLESDVNWQTLTGPVAGRVEWPASSRIQITNTVVIAADAELHIGPGSVVRLGPGVNLEVFGKLTAAGTLTAPVVFTPERRSSPWGGMMFRTNTSVGEFSGTVFTGSGANAKWFTDNKGYEVHRKEQALFLLETGSQVSLVDCFALDNKGQAGHGKKANFTLTRSLINRCITGGEYAGGSVKLLQSALLEFPQDDGIFADDDNDAIYFTTGDHYVIDSLVGWAKDDSLDAGTGGLGSMTVSNSWVESSFHEGMAWSGDNGRNVRVDHTVAMNCGQGLEAGFGKPNVHANQLLSLGNLTGARFGDNYDWTYAGFLRVTNSILLHNFRDVWGQTWTPGAWTNELDQMDIRGNFLTVANPLYPENQVWEPTQAAQLATFLGGLADKPVGMGFAIRGPQISQGDWTNGVPIGLSRFHTESVQVGFRIRTLGGADVREGRIQFAAGETIKRIPPVAASAAPPDTRAFVVDLFDPSGGELTGRPQVFFPNLAPSAPFTSVLVGKKSVWKYWDKGSAPTNNWLSFEADETGWKSGRGELGFGDNDEATVVASGPTNSHYTAYYFRRRFELPPMPQVTNLSVGFLRDDGGIVYLNGTEIFRSNMPEGRVDYEDTASGSTSSETEYFRTNAPASLLRGGGNLLSVEVHQSTTNSADLSFDLEVVGEQLVPQPSLQLIPVGEELWLVWTQAGFVLQAASSAEGPWTTVSGIKPPVGIAATRQSRFYRLALP